MQLIIFKKEGDEEVVEIDKQTLALNFKKFKEIESYAFKLKRIIMKKKGKKDKNFEKMIAAYLKRRNMKK